MANSQHRPYSDLRQLNRPGKFNVTIRDRNENSRYGDRPQSSGASSSCSWFISNDTHNVGIGTDIADHDINPGQDTGEQYESAIHLIGGAYNSNVTCSNRNCARNLNETFEHLNDATSLKKGNKTVSVMF